MKHLLHVWVETEHDSGIDRVRLEVEAALHREMPGWRPAVRPASYVPPAVLEYMKKARAFCDLRYVTFFDRDTFEVYESDGVQVDLDVPLGHGLDASEYQRTLVEARNAVEAGYPMPVTFYYPGPSAEDRETIGEAIERLEVIAELKLESVGNTVIHTLINQLKEALK